jgi:8-oxo-dGTP diphosphatase
LRTPLSRLVWSMVLRLYVVTDWSGVPHNRAPEEHSEISWFAIEDACRLALAHPAYPALLRKVASVASSTARED